MNFKRIDAYQLLTEYTQKKALIYHALSVEAAMRAYAAKFGEDVEAWGMVGLLHDFDYEKYPTPDAHPFVGVGILREKGYPESWIEAILGHADYSGVPRNSLMAKTLFAVDELCGLITAVAYVRPSRKLAEVQSRSVKKKMKDKRFAAAVSREDIREGAAALGVELDAHIEFTIQAMQGIADDIGL